MFIRSVALNWGLNDPDDAARIHQEVYWASHPASPRCSVCRVRIDPPVGSTPISAHNTHRSAARLCLWCCAINISLELPYILQQSISAFRWLLTRRSPTTGRLYDPTKRLLFSVPGRAAVKMPLRRPNLLKSLPAPLLFGSEADPQIRYYSSCEKLT